MSISTPHEVYVDDRQYVVRGTKTGGMGKVWLLEDKYPDPSAFSLGSRIAVKTFESTPKNCAVDAELNNWVALEHPHILRLIKIGKLNFRTAAIMPWRAGTIEDVLRDRPILPIGVVVKVGIQIAQALQYAFETAKLVHLDIKPANILTRSEDPEHIEVSDWGISRIAAQLSASAWLKKDVLQMQNTSYGAGTLLYMSPERFSGDWVIGPSADIYSLGMILIEMLVGTLPYRLEDKTPYEEIISGTYLDNAVLLTCGLPPDLSTTILKFIAPKPGDRFDSYTSAIRRLKCHL